MTSTVLDVTVLLLCVSASVVVLGGVGDDVGTPGPTAAEAADRLVTETVTVRYRAPEAANDTRTVHATRAELLALLVANAERTDDGGRTAQNRVGANGETFESRATTAVAAGLDRRTRIDATIPAVERRERGAARATEDVRTVTVGSEPPRNADVATTVITHPSPDTIETDAPVRIVVRRW